MRPSKKEMNSSWGRFFGSWGYTLAASDKKSTPRGDERSPSRAGVQDDPSDTGDRSRGVWLDAADFTPEETWRLLRWCQDQGADEFSVSFYDRDAGPINAFFRCRAKREIAHGPSGWCDFTALFHLNRESITALQSILPSGLFQFSCGDRTGWAEDPVVYRNGRLMLGIISHEGIAELRISKREEEALATIGLRGDFLDYGETGAQLSLGPVTVEVLGHEFPCLSGDAGDDWLRVHLTVEHAPHNYVTYQTLNITTKTITEWQSRMEAVVAGQSAGATLRTVREGLLLNLTLPDTNSSVTVAVDARQMDSEYRRDFWQFNVETADVARLSRQCATVVREHEANLPVRPRASLPNDPERAVRAGRRYLLVAGGA